MQNKEIEKLLSCEITCTDRDKIRKYIYELEAEILTHKSKAESWRTAFDTGAILIEFYQKDIKKLENKVKELGKEKQNFIERLKNDQENLELVHDNYIDADVVEKTYEILGRLNYIREVLKILEEK